MNSKNILYISYDGMTDNLGQSQVIPYLIGLTKNGYNFTIISCEKKQHFEQQHLKIQQLLTVNKIDWKPIFYTKKPPILSTIYDVYKIQKLAKKLHQQKQFLALHCRSYISALIGLNFKKKYQTKFIFDMRGLWADERVDAKLWNLKNPVFKMVYNYFKNKETEFLENADYTISLTENAKNDIRTWKTIDQNKVKIAIIPCCVDLDLFQEKNIKTDDLLQLKNQLNINNTDFVLSYLGSIGTWYMLDEMLDFFVVLQQKMANAKFLFITKDEHDLIFAKAKIRNIENNIIIKPGNRNEIPNLIAISNFSIFFIKPTYSKISSSPTKQGEIMAMGIPIICNSKIGDTDKIIEKYNAGFIINDFNTNNYLQIINQIGHKKFDNFEIINGAEKYFSLENGVQKYYEIYNSIL